MVRRAWMCSLNGIKVWKAFFSCIRVFKIPPREWNVDHLRQLKLRFSNFSLWHCWFFDEKAFCWNVTIFMNTKLLAAGNFQSAPFQSTQQHESWLFTFPTFDENKIIEVMVCTSINSHCNSMLPFKKQLHMKLASAALSFHWIMTQKLQTQTN